MDHSKEKKVKYYGPNDLDWTHSKVYIAFYNLSYQSLENKLM